MHFGVEARRRRSTIQESIWGYLVEEVVSMAVGDLGRWEARMALEIPTILLAIQYADKLIQLSIDLIFFIVVSIP